MDADLIGDTYEFNFNTDPDPTFHLDADPDPDIFLRGSGSSSKRLEPVTLDYGPSSLKHPLKASTAPR
jgi:hypothetical protein